MRISGVFAGLALVFAVPASAAAPKAGDQIDVKDPVVRLVPPGIPTTGIFLVLENRSEADHALVQASSPSAKVVELHTHFSEGGIMKMRRVERIPVPAKGTAVLKPGGYHIMLIELTGPLSEKTTVQTTLQFEDGSTKVIHAEVVRPGIAPGSHSH